MSRRLLMLLSVAAASAGAAEKPVPLPQPGSKYVAMGSSFAAGPGIGRTEEGAPERCGRSTENYAHLLALARHLALVDVTCGGATTQHILGPWNELPAQISAVDGDTRLVTMTIGGNDLNYIGSLAGYSCRRVPPNPANRAVVPNCSLPVAPGESTYRDVENRLRQIAEEVRRRAPLAQFVILQYPTMLPARGSCTVVPISDEEAAQVKVVGRRLAQITARVARDTGAKIVPVDRLSQRHDACSDDAWVNGFSAPFKNDGVLYHPNRAGMAAQARAIEQLVWGAKR